MNPLILYTTEDGRSRIQLRADGQTVWLTQRQMAELFQSGRQSIAKHLKAIFADGELPAGSVINPWLTATADGNRSRTASAGFGLGREASVKKYLTVQTVTKSQATTEESSVVRLRRRRQIQRPANSANPVQATRWLTLLEHPA